MKLSLSLLSCTVVLVTMSACQSAPPAVPTPGVTELPPSPSATPVPSATPSAAPSATPTATDTTASLEVFSGTWQLDVSNARVLSAVGRAAGGSVSLADDRFVFSAGDYSVEGAVDLVGTLEVECGETSCSFIGAPLSVIWLVDGQPMIVDPMYLTPLGSFDGSCGWEDIPEGGVLNVEETAVVDGREVPTVVSFVAGTAGGVGTDCADASWVVAWDVTGTRLP